MVFLILGCGAKPGNPTPPEDINADLAAYHFVNAIGSTYDITGKKLIFTPASEADSVDGIEDDGYYTELNITRNEYAKLAAIFEQELERTQDTPDDRDPSLPVPKLSRDGGGKNDLVTNLDYQGLHAINHALEPFLNDQ